MKKFKINDTEIAYGDQGTGQPIVFLHAFPLNQKMWGEQVAEFSTTHRVITLDWPGFGESSLGSTASTMSAFADDLAALLDQLKIESAIVCGLSMGGYVALAFYRKYANLVTALVLCDTRAGADAEEGKRGRYEMAELARTKGVSAIAEKMIPRLLGKTTLKANPQAVEQVRNMIEDAQTEGVAQALIGMAQRPDSTDLLSAIDCPVLIIVGDEDELTPPVEAEKMSNIITSSRMEVIAGAGHLSNLEQSPAFNRVLKDFLSTV